MIWFTVTHSLRSLHIPLPYTLIFAFTDIPTLPRIFLVADARFTHLAFTFTWLRSTLYTFTHARDFLPRSVRFTTLRSRLRLRALPLFITFYTVPFVCGCHAHVYTRTTLVGCGYALVTRFHAQFHTSALRTTHGFYLHSFHVTRSACVYLTFIAPAVVVLHRFLRFARSTGSLLPAHCARFFAFTPHMVLARFLVHNTRLTAAPRILLRICAQRCYRLRSLAYAVPGSLTHAGSYRLHYRSGSTFRYIWFCWLRRAYRGCRAHAAAPLPTVPRALTRIALHVHNATHTHATRAYTALAFAASRHNAVPYLVHRARYHHRTHYCPHAGLTATAFTRFHARTHAHHHALPAHTRCVPAHTAAFT